MELTSLPLTSLPIPDAHASCWGLDVFADAIGGERWVPVELRPHGGPHGRPTRWFPIASFNAETIRRLAGDAGARVRVFFQTRNHRRPLNPVAEFLVEPAPPQAATVEVQATAPIAQATPPTPTPPAPRPQAPRPPAPQQAPAPPPLGPASHAGDLFERLHHLAHQDGAEVVSAVTALAASTQQTIAQLASITMAVTGQRAQDWQQMAQHAQQQQAAAQAAQQPALAAILQKLQQLEAQNAALAAQAAAAAAAIEEMREEEDEADDPRPAQEPSEAQKLMAVIASGAIEYGPKIAAKLWPETPAAPQLPSAEGS
jgi:hypothetical protein